MDNPTASNTPASDNTKPVPTMEELSALHLRAEKAWLDYLIVCAEGQNAEQGAKAADVLATLANTRL